MSKPKILIVDDEFLIRAVLVDLFEEDGWEVKSASSGDEAVALLNGFDVNVTDIEMPGDTDGLALSWAAHNRTPGVPILLMSGRQLPLKSEMPPTAHFLAKPVPSDVLLSFVRELVFG